ncbi:hypothetical protein BD413DRAFT_289419 [Trametes elegans]|nr:hypothetical protein BD413DRAFT_289419 [Trametes elegans]
MRCNPWRASSPAAMAPFDAPLYAHMIAFAVEAVLFGALCILYPLSIWLLWLRRGRRGRKGFGLRLLVLTTLMFLLSATTVGVDTANSFIGYTMQSGQGPVASFAYFYQLNAPAYAMKTVLFSVLTMLGDGFMAFRVYVVWGRNLRVLGPSLPLLISTFATGLYSAYALHKSSNVSSVNTARTGASIFLSLSLITNVTITSLLLGRLLWCERQMRVHRLQTDISVHWKVMKTIILSEVWYSAALVVNLALYASDSSILFVTLDALPPLVSISFTLIIVGVGLGEAMDDMCLPGADAMASSPTLAASRRTGRRQRVSTIVFNTDPLHTSTPISANPIEDLWPPSPCSRGGE